MENKTTSTKKLNWLATASWLLIALAFLALFLADLGLDYEQIQQPCSGVDCNYVAVSQAEMDILEAWGLNGQIFSLIVNGSTLLAVSLFWLLGGALFWRQGSTRAGWFFSLALIVIPITLISDVDNVAFNYPSARIPILLVPSIGNAIMFTFLYTFPNGKFYPRWALVPFAITIFTFTVDISEMIAFPAYVEELIALVFTSVLLMGVGIQILRYRLFSTKLERQQTKWGLLGIFILVMAVPAWFALIGDGIEFPAGEARLLATMLGWPVILTMLMTLPLTIAIAILRYRLWDVDVIIRRTLQYALLTGLLALAYFGGVVLLQGVLGPLTGQADSPLVAVLTTLGVAALFSPLRRRVQEFIDRRFYRKKYDAEQALAEFAAAASRETDLAQLSGSLTGTVQEALQPEQVSLWITPYHSPQTK